MFGSVYVFIFQALHTRANMEIQNTNYRFKETEAYVSLQQQNEWKELNASNMHQIFIHVNLHTFTALKKIVQIM